MAAQKLHRRFMSTALIGGPLLAGGIAWATPAQADEASYLNDLHNAGIHAESGGDAALLQTGWKICQQIGYGTPLTELRNLALQRSDGTEGSNGLTVPQANDLVDFALFDLCPRA
jgi:hypothetical protein